jgi:ABC-type uncharacterized transport system ATPase component
MGLIYCRLIMDSTCPHTSTSMSMLLKASHSPALVLQNADRGASSPACREHIIKQTADIFQQKKCTEIMCLVPQKMVAQLKRDASYKQFRET